jgi:hypothetical protein
MMTLSDMATRKPQKTEVPLNECTAFQIYSSFASTATNVFDFVERRLIVVIESEVDPKRKRGLQAMLDEYRHGQIALAFWHGAPTYLRVMKND